MKFGKSEDVFHHFGIDAGYRYNQVRQYRWRTDLHTYLLRQSGCWSSRMTVAVSMTVISEQTEQFCSYRVTSKLPVIVFVTLGLNCTSTVAEIVPFVFVPEIDVITT